MVIDWVVGKMWTRNSHLAGGQKSESCTLLYGRWTVPLGGVHTEEDSGGKQQKWKPFWELWKMLNKRNSSILMQICNTTKGHWLSIHGLHPTYPTAYKWSKKFPSTSYSHVHTVFLLTKYSGCTLNVLYRKVWCVRLSAKHGAVVMSTLQND